MPTNAPTRPAANPTPAACGGPCSCPPVAAAVSAILNQCSRFIEALPADLYTRTSQSIKGGTIGKHVRHTVDHFAAALACLDTRQPIDYDRRAREVPMETSPDVAIQAIDALRRRVESLDDRALRGPVQIQVMLTGDGAEATLDSSLGRELHFAFHHAVHHHAMLKAIACEFGCEPAPEFGLAPSTLNYVKSK